MKGINQMLAMSLIVLASACSSTRNTTSTPSDDVYYSKGDAQESPQPAMSHPSPSNRNSGDTYSEPSQQGSQQQDNSQDYYRKSDTASTGTQNQNANTINNYYNSDHYDYSNSAKLRRYYDPMSGYRYYDPYYTNSYYYDNNPASYGSSIYLGYNFWGPSVSFGIGFGWGYPSYGYGYYGYPSYGYPYYGYGYPYYGYPYYGYPSYGYPYCGYHNPYYYNSYDANSSYYYGPRGSVSSTGRTSTGRTGAAPPRTLGEKYQQAVADNRVSSFSSGGGHNVNPDNPVRQSLETSTRTSTLRTGNPGESGGTITNNPSRNSLSQDSKSSVLHQGVITDRANTGGIISGKNETGRTTVQTNGSAHDGRLAQNPGTERSNGGNVHPNNNVSITGGQHLPSRSNAVPNNNSIQGSPGSRGGSAQPNPGNQGNNNRTVPRMNEGRRYQNSAPGNFDTPRKERNSERPRQYQQSQPRFDQKIFRQEAPQQHQQQNSSPSPQRNNSAPSGPSNGRSGGRR